MQRQRTQRRAGGAAAPALRLLLFLAVLLGVGAMHTLGHFEGHGHAGHAESAAAAHSAGAPEDGAQNAALQGPAASAGHAAGTAATGGADGPEATGQQHSQGSATGADLPPLDPASVCLALAGLALAALHLAVSALPRTPAPAAAPVRGGRARAPSAERPPEPPSLSALQVLRI